MTEFDNIKKENRELLDLQAFIKDVPIDVINFDVINKERDEIEDALYWNGIDFVFYKCPELRKIGTKKQYAEYIKTVFPNSIHKNIVYHGSKNWENFEIFEHKSSVNFNYNHHSFFFTSSIADAESGWTGEKKRKDEVIPVILNISRQHLWVLKEWYVMEKIEDRLNLDEGDIDNLEHIYSQELSTDWEKNYNKDNYTDWVRIDPSTALLKKYTKCKKIGVWKWNRLVMDLSDNLWYIWDINKDKVDLLKKEWITSIIHDVPWLQNKLWLEWDKNRFIVFNPWQIHILWSKSDIELFKEYIRRTTPPIEFGKSKPVIKFGEKS